MRAMFLNDRTGMITVKNNRNYSKGRVEQEEIGGLCGFSEEHL